MPENICFSYRDHSIWLCTQLPESLLTPTRLLQSPGRLSHCLLPHCLGRGRKGTQATRESGHPKPVTEATLPARPRARRTPGRHPASVSALSNPRARPQVWTSFRAP